MLPQNKITLSGDELAKFNRLIDALDDLDDVQNVYTNADLSALVNVWDPNRESYYWYYFNTSTTPMVYVMDENHKIFAKKIDVDTLYLIAENELK